jgi:hypothetical protein
LPHLIAVGLVSAGLATATPQSVVVGKNRYEIPTLRMAAGTGCEMTIREEIAFSFFVAAAMLMGWKLVLSALHFVLM